MHERKRKNKAKQFIHESESPTKFVTKNVKSIRNKRVKKIFQHFFNCVTNVTKWQ